jgi:hypothetical protein
MKLIFSLSVAGVVVLILFLYALFGADRTSDTATSTTEPSSAEQQVVEETKTPQVLTGQGAFAELKDLGRNLECRIQYVAEDMTEPVIGTYFVSQGRIRADFEVPAPELGGQIVSSMIYTDEMYYAWSDIDGQLYGVSANIATLDTFDQASLNEPVSADDLVSYECTQWEVVDGSVFEPPADVLFQDLSSILDAGMEYGTIYTEGEF